jgi:hypothetical protein
MFRDILFNMKQTTLIPLILALILAGAACQKPPTRQSSNQAPTTNQATQNSNTDVSTSEVHWDNSNNANGWMASGTPPACPDPFVIQLPVDLTKVTAVLYPGQSRPDYKPHGGLRFDTAGTNDIAYNSPITGEIIRGGRYLVNGEIQYTFDIVHPCGMMARVGHLLALTPKFQAIADQFPAATEGDSRTTRVQPQVPVAQGEQIATKVGLSVGGVNAFADIGLFDLRKLNDAAGDPAYAAIHDVELEQHALCWFDNLTASDEAAIRALPPGDPTAGKSSDYCLQE